MTEHDNDTEAAPPPTFRVRHALSGAVLASGLSAGLVEHAPSVEQELQRLADGAGVDVDVLVVEPEAP